MKYIAWLMISALLTLNVSADFTLTKAPEVVSKTDSSVTIEWESLEGSMGCYYSYSNESVENGEEWAMYEVEWEDLIEENTVSIEDLEKDKTYYIAMECMDENAETTGYSPELVLNLSEEDSNSTEVEANNEEVVDASIDTEEVATLELLEVSVVDSTVLRLSFNNDLEKSETAEREVRIVSNWNELSILSFSLFDNKTLDVQLESEMNVSTEYDLTVISLKDLNGNNIEAWVDGVANFTTPSEFIVEEPIEEVIEEEWVELEAASAEVTKLPDTGAKEVFLVLLALLLWVLVINFNKRTS